LVRETYFKLLPRSSVFLPFQSRQEFLWSKARRGQHIRPISLFGLFRRHSGNQPQLWFFLTDFVTRCRRCRSCGRRCRRNRCWRRRCCRCCRSALLQLLRFFRPVVAEGATPFKQQKRLSLLLRRTAAQPSTKKFPHPPSAFFQAWVGSSNTTTAVGRNTPFVSLNYILN
jgi:hypothetical protein